MVTLEQVRLLETKVAKAIDYVNQVSGENNRLRTTLEDYRRRIDELEVLVQQFKEDQGRIEKGIISALDRLNRFEDAIEKSLSAAGGAVSAAPEAGNPDRPGEGDSVPEAGNQAAGSAEDSLYAGDHDVSGTESETRDLPGGAEDVQELDIF